MKTPKERGQAATLRESLEDFNVGIVVGMTMEYTILESAVHLEDLLTLTNDVLLPISHPEPLQKLFVKFMQRGRSDAEFVG